MSEQTQSMSDFLDDLWSNLDNSPAVPQPPGTARPAPPQHATAPAPIQRHATVPNQNTQQAIPPVQHQPPRSRYNGSRLLCVIRDL